MRKAVTYVCDGLHELWDESRNAIRAMLKCHVHLTRLYAWDATNTVPTFSYGAMKLCLINKQSADE